MAIEKASRPVHAWNSVDHRQSTPSNRNLLHGLRKLNPGATGLKVTALPTVDPASNPRVLPVETFPGEHCPLLRRFFPSSSAQRWGSPVKQGPMKIHPPSPAAEELAPLRPPCSSVPDSTLRATPRRPETRPCRWGYRHDAGRHRQNYSSIDIEEVGAHEPPWMNKRGPGTSCRTRSAGRHSSMPFHSRPAERS